MKNIIITIIFIYKTLGSYTVIKNKQKTKKIKLVNFLVSKYLSKKNIKKGEIPKEIPSKRWLVFKKVKYIEKLKKN
jgi:hypothetical protein